MYLTSEEEKALDGEFGTAVQTAMKILVTIGDIFEADRLIPVSSVHMPGSSVVVSGRAGAKFVGRMADEGGLFRVLTTLNPAATDLEMWREMGVPEEVYREQLELTEAYRKMGAVDVHTCIPYLAGNTPAYGSDVAWGESSAVVYANSVLGARTNREGGPSALASAIAGKTPRYGMHLEENRVPTVRVKVEAEVGGVEAYGSLGYYVGKVAEDGVPFIEGLPRGVWIDELKMLSAALATSGAVPMFHAPGITPEASLKGVREAVEGLEVVEVGRGELGEVREKLCTADAGDVSAVCVGCPHASVSEVLSVLRTLGDRKTNLTFWMFTSMHIKHILERMGILTRLSSLGIQILCDTCPILAPMKDISKSLGVDAVATNSAKLAHYLNSKYSVKTFYGSLERCVEVAVSGGRR